jgi:hypothetical protein
MIAYRNLYLFAIIGMMVAIGSSVGAAETATDSASFSTPTTTDTPTASAPATSHKNSHRKKKKSATASATGTANAGTASTAPAKTTPGASTTAAATQPGATAKATAGKKTATAKSSRKKSKSKLAKAATKPPAISPIDIPGGVTPSAPISVYSSPLPSGTGSATAPVTVTKSAGDTGTQITISAPAASGHPAGGPEVDTGLPVARHSTLGPDGSLTVPHQTAATYQIASAFPISPAISTLGSYVPASHVKTPIDNFVFTNFNRRARNTYPWKMNIYTTIFWIGEGGTTISSTDNVESAWDQDWRSNNGGSDTPNDRRGYMPANHAARMNPFYVALPFNDLAFPDKAHRWLPVGWYHSSREGKQVSACKDRWVEIKNAQGETCYAQWEDVGPLRYDHAEYVFGDERPDTLTHAGLDVSPAVADYLNITGKNCITRWRFVDDADVPPGYWLKYDEEALIFRAMHDLKDDSIHVLPVQRATAPIDDENDSDANKKRLNAAKG